MNMTARPRQSVKTILRRCIQNPPWMVRAVMCEPEQETRESRSGTALERQFLGSAGNRMLVPRLRAGCQCGVICLHNSCWQGAAFTAIMTIANIAGHTGCQKLCETIHALSALSQ